MNHGIGLAGGMVLLLAAAIQSAVGWTYMGLGFASFPLLLLGARLKMPVGNRMSHRTLSRVSGLVLLLISVSAVTQSLMALSRHHPTEGEHP